MERQAITISITENDLQEFQDLVLNSIELFTWTFPDQDGIDIDITFIKDNNE